MDLRIDLFACFDCITDRFVIYAVEPLLQRGCVIRDGDLGRFSRKYMRALGQIVDIVDTKK